MIFRDNNAILRLDIRFLLVCMLLILIRLFIPIESPIANNIPVNKIYPDIYMLLKYPRFTVKNIEVNFIMILACIWFGGAVIAMVRLVYSYVSVKKQVEGFVEIKDFQIIKVMQCLNEKNKLSVQFKLVTSDTVYTPFVFGILNPYIVITPNSFTEEELYFVLEHEIAHYYRGDMITKLFCEILKAIYWWNPFVYILAKIVADMQEINVDFSIIKKLPELKQLDYLGCLIKVARSREKKKSENRWLIAFQKESPSATHKRIKLMLENMEISKGKTLVSIILSAGILCLVVLCPNVLIFEPYSISEEDAAGSFGLNDNMYYIHNQNDTYSIYLQGQYVGTISEVFGENVQVYSNLKEVEGNE